MRKFTSLILCLFLISTLGMFLGCKKKEPVPEEEMTSWMATEDKSQYLEMAWEEQAGEEQEEEHVAPSVAPSLEGDEESSGEEEYQEEQKPSQEEEEPSQEEEYEWE